MRHLGTSGLTTNDRLVFLLLAARAQAPGVFPDAGERAPSRAVAAEVVVVTPSLDWPNLQPDTERRAILQYHAHEGGRAIHASVRPQRLWSAAGEGGLHVFAHEEWPGAYGAVNLHPAFWSTQPVTMADIVLHARLLPDDPLTLTGAPTSGLRRSCCICHAGCDLRFTFGHDLGDGKSILWVGTDEVIVEVEGTDRRFLEVGAFCATCIEAWVGNGDLRSPEGMIYDPERNRSVPAGTVLAEVDIGTPDSADPIARARRRYGAAAVEWRTLEAEPGCRERLDRLDAEFRSRRRA